MMLDDAHMVVEKNFMLVSNVEGFLWARHITKVLSFC